MIDKTKHRSRSRAILLVLVVMALATAGLVYAHWTETLKVDATVRTGNATLVIVAAQTDDDGSTVGGWSSGNCNDNNGGPTLYDRWGASSSNDPSSYCGASGYATPRYDKDVARCQVTEQGIGGTVSTVLVENAYPSYHCTIRQTFRNSGSIPLKNQATRVYACGPTSLVDCSSYPTNFQTLSYVRATDSFSFDSNYDGNADFELLMQHNPEGVCGTQWDPRSSGDNGGSRVTFHVLQGAAPSTSYVLRFVLETVNWNEYSLANCYGFSNQPMP